MKLFIILTILGFSKGDVGYNFLTLPFGYDGASFRTALVANAGSPFSDFYNPALLPDTKLSSFVSSYLVGTRYGGFSYSVQENIRAGAFFLTTGSIDKTNEEGVKIGSYSSNYMALFIRYLPGETVKFLGRDIINGVGVKLLYQGIDDKNSLAVVADAGAYLKFNNFINIGASVTNLGYEIKPFVDKRYFPPMQVVLGASIKPVPSLKVLASGGYELGYGFILDLGMDFHLLKIASLRAGYTLKGRDLNTGGSWDVLNGFSAGFSITVRNVQVGYTAMPMGELGLTHFIGVSF